jgi:S-formylglutathione hydrolase FrmB
MGLVAAFAAAAPAHAKSDAARVVTWDGPAVSKSPFIPASIPLKANVYLPAGYANHPGRRYPILWLLHGHGGNYHSWTDASGGDLLNTARSFPGLIVMPEADDGWYANWWNGGKRADPAWERYHLDQLMPYANRRLRVKRGRRWHAIAGLSMGGEGAMYYASQRPGYFGSAASFSGPLSLERPEWPTGFNTQGEDFDTVFGGAGSFYVTGHNPTALIGNLHSTRLFVSVGDGIPDPTIPSEVEDYFGQAAELDLRQHAIDFVNAAHAAGDDITYTPHQGIHAWHYWKHDLQHAIRDWGLFKPPPETGHRWTYSTVSKTGTMWQFGFQFARPPTGVTTFTRHGQYLSGEGRSRVKIIYPDGCWVKPKLPFEHLPTRCPAPPPPGARPRAGRRATAPAVRVRAAHASARG